MADAPARGAAARRTKTAARLYAVQALFQMESSGQTVRAVVAEFLAHRFGATYEEGTLADGDAAHFRAVVEASVNWQALIDQATDRALVAKWPIERIDPVLRALFRAAGAELAHMTTPPKVVISEYLIVARAFLPDERELAFVNAVLDHMARELRPSFG